MLKSLKIVYLSSPLHDREAIWTCRKEQWKTLQRRYFCTLTPIQEYDGVMGKEEAVIFFIATGGSESLFLSYREKMSGPKVFLSDGFHNSLAAALEIASRIALDKQACIHIHGFEALTSEKIEMIYRLQQGWNNLQKKRIAIFGGISPWLIASQVATDTVTKRWGVTFCQLPISELEQRLLHAAPKFMAQAAAQAQNLLSQASACIEPELAEVERAVLFYLILAEMCKERQIDALTIKCFDLLSHAHVTACLALSMLNDNGIVAGCEGDIPALWSMLIVNALTGQPSFMVNPVDLHSDPCIIDLAHCTLPTTLCHSYALRNHFESGISVAIQGDFSPGRYTLFKCGGPLLDQYTVTEGELEAAPYLSNRCRTQLRLRTDRPVREVLEARLGNHVVVVPGSHQSILDSFFLFG